MKRPPLEKDIERKIRDYAIKQGCRAYKFTSPMNRAVHDRIIIAPGKAPGTAAVGFLEIKRPGCKPTLLQAKTINQFTADGCYSGWVDNLADAKAFIAELQLKAAGLVKDKPTDEEPDFL